MTRAGSNGDRPARGAVKVSGGLTCREGPNRDEATGPTGSPCGYAPTGVAQARRDGEHPEAESDLLAAILEQDNLRRAWQQVKANHGAAGVDGVTIEEFPDKFRAHWPQLRQALEEGTYEPSPVRRVEMAKPDGGIRLLGIPTVLDRLIQQAIAQVLGPIFDPGFSACSFGFRPGRRAGDAVRHVAKHIGTGRRFAVDLDLSKFFDRVAHDILMSRLARKVSDRRVLRLSSAIASRDSLIGRYLRAGVEVEGRFERTVRGVPQGSPLSPLLANVVLDDLDKELEQRGHRFARYADDFVILVKSPRAGERVMRSVRRFLETRLKLEVNVEKSAVRPTAELTFLGFAFKGVACALRAGRLASSLSAKSERCAAGAPCGSSGVKSRSSVSNTASGNSRAATGASVCSIACANSHSICGAGWATSASAKPMPRFVNSITGSAAGCAAVIGRCGRRAAIASVSSCALASSARMRSCTGWAVVAVGPARAQCGPPRQLFAKQTARDAPPALRPR
jgi:RNA-directed DNA polymerase